MSDSGSTSPVKALGEHFRALDARYHGPEGDRFAIEELAPVAARFLPVNGRALEVGCGYGRNLMALASLPGRAVVGCDPWFATLQRAAHERIATLPVDRRERVSLVRQERFQLPFRDGSFDLVVLWQVLEHVHGEQSKQALLDEVVRVLRPGGHVLIETPNQWFPFDYHDNKLPLVHWLLPSAAREWLTWKIRGERYPPSDYRGVSGYAALLRRAPGVTRATKATRVYFARSYAEAWRHLAGTQIGLKRLLFVLLAPVHAALSPFGGSADWFLPSIRVVWQIEKRAEALESRRAG